ncbi:MAG TPA: hypothetical protein VGM36_06125, partial [Rhizomicrobium sp.]
MISRTAFALVMIALPAFAAEPIALPFSKLPVFPAPELMMGSLSPEVAANVKTALSDAAKGNQAARLAEAAIRAAEA